MDNCSSWALVERTEELLVEMVAVAGTGEVPPTDKVVVPVLGDTERVTPLPGR